MIAKTRGLVLIVLNSIRERASATTLLLPLMYSIVKEYSDKSRCIRINFDEGSFSIVDFLESPLVKVFEAKAMGFSCLSRHWL